MAFSLTALLIFLTGCQSLPSGGLPWEKPKAAAQAEEAVVEEEAPAEPEPIPEPQETAKPGQMYEWNGDGRNISRIVVSIDEQRMRFYDGQEQIGWTTVATGVTKHPTPTGEFEVLEKVKDKRSNVYGKILNSKGGVYKSGADSRTDKVPPGGKWLGARMPNFQRLTYDGIGFHAGPIPRPGHRASHGCIRMPKKMSETLYRHTGVGTKVSIIGTGPDYGNYAERVRKERELQRLAAEEKMRMDAQRAAREAALKPPTPAAPAGVSAAASPSAPPAGVPATPPAAPSSVPVSALTPAPAAVPATPAAPAPPPASVVDDAATAPAPAAPSAPSVDEASMPTGSDSPSIPVRPLDPRLKSA